VKEKQRIKYYSRYMDDFVLIHESKEYLKMCLAEIKELVESLGLELNPKTQIFPIKNGVDYLGFHIYLTETGKVVRKLRRTSKKAMMRRLAAMQEQYAKGEVDYKKVKQRINSWIGHAKHGHTYHLRKHILKDAVFQRQTVKEEDN
jgi:DNA-binding transcriptional MerR regulator